MNKLIPAVLFTVLLGLFIGTSQVARADSHLNRSMTVFVVDRHAAGNTSGTDNVISSVLGVFSKFRQGRLVAYIEVENSLEALGPVEAGSFEFTAFEQEISSNLRSPLGQDSADLVGALTNTYNFLADEQAKPGSEVYLITGGELIPLGNSALEHLSLVLSLYTQNGWEIVGLNLPGSSPSTVEFLELVSSETGGQVIELSVPAGLKQITDQMLTVEAKGAMVDLGGGELSASEVFTATIDIPPGTGETTMLFFKQDPFGSLRLKNPSGFEASLGDRSVSSVVETPHIVIWSLIDPIPGKWSVDIRGAQGTISSWQYTDNKYSLALASYDSLPVGAPASIVAYVTDGNNKVDIDDVIVRASITTPDGGTISHDLNDNGTSGDAVAGDGYYSVSVPPLNAIGDYLVDLELSWPDSDVAVITREGFVVQPFPSVEITPVQLKDIRPGETVKVATAMVNVLGEPYAISVDDITASLVTNAETNGTIVLKPQRLLEQGRTWSFDVLFTPSAEGLHTLTFDMNLEYLGRGFVYKSPALTLSSIMPAAPPPPREVVVVPAPPAPEPPPPVVVVPATFPWIAVIIPLAALALIIVAAGVFWLTRSGPHGYLYTDRNELVADLSKVKRSILRVLFSKSQVTGAELGAQGLERVSFKFNGKTIGLNTPQITPTIRVNNQPLVGETTIQDRTWIGAHGKLYNFLLRPLVTQDVAPAVGDD